MNLQVARDILLWITILNGCLLIFSSLICVFARKWAYTIHNRFFPMSCETHSVILYGFIGFYKILFITFNLIPYIALEILVR